ncbi:uncharacterized protein [Tursiops truncatus]|uniref:uncharacterized protein n=1 Tax=Tursiops truncatus TaxID=9739 RepID=UPI003CCF94C3
MAALWFLRKKWSLVSPSIYWRQDPEALMVRGPLGPGETRGCQTQSQRGRRGSGSDGSSKNASEEAAGTGGPRARLTAGRDSGSDDSGSCLMQFMRTLFSLLKTPHQLTKRNHPRVNQDIPLTQPSTASQHLGPCRTPPLPRFPPGCCLGGRSIGTVGEDRRPVTSSPTRHGLTLSLGKAALGLPSPRWGACAARGRGPRERTKERRPREPAASGLTSSARSPARALSTRARLRSSRAASAAASSRERLETPRGAARWKALASRRLRSSSSGLAAGASSGPATLSPPPVKPREGGRVEGLSPAPTRMPWGPREVPSLRRLESPKDISETLGSRLVLLKQQTKEVVPITSRRGFNWPPFSCSLECRSKGRLGSIQNADESIQRTTSSGTLKFCCVVSEQRCAEAYLPQTRKI